MKRIDTIMLICRIFTISILTLLVMCGCAGERMTCPAYTDTHKQHWMNSKFNTNIFYYDSDLFTKWNKSIKQVKK